jgi:hypothetical protein
MAKKRRKPRPAGPSPAAEPIEPPGPAKPKPPAEPKPKEVHEYLVSLDRIEQSGTFRVVAASPEAAAEKALENAKLRKLQFDPPRHRFTVTSCRKV